MHRNGQVLLFSKHFSLPVVFIYCWSKCVMPHARPILSTVLIYFLFIPYLVCTRGLDCLTLLQTTRNALSIRTAVRRHMGYRHQQTTKHLKKQQSITPPNFPRHRQKNYSDFFFVPLPPLPPHPHVPNPAFFSPLVPSGIFFVVASVDRCPPPTPCPLFLLGFFCFCRSNTRCSCWEAVAAERAA